MKLHSLGKNSSAIKTQESKVTTIYGLNGQTIKQTELMTYSVFNGGYNVNYYRLQSTSYSYSLRTQFEHLMLQTFTDIQRLW